MDETDIWRSAHFPIQQHGNIAEFVACSRIDAMIEKGDPAGEATWKRVLQAIKALRRVARKTSESLQ